MLVWHNELMTPAELVEVLTRSRALGFLGDRAIDEVIEHAGGFVDALADVTGSAVDLGAGGGVPGFVLAAARPDLTLTLVDRRTKRTDFLERMVFKYSLRDSVRVEAVDTDTLIATHGAIFDAAVARGFGPPLVTLSTGVQLVKIGGRIVISEPPAGDRWNDADLERLGVTRGPSVRGVVVFSRVR